MSALDETPGLDLWFDPGTLSSLDDGDPISSWANSGPAGGAVTASGTQRPVYRPNSNDHLLSRPAVFADRANDRLESSGLGDYEGNSGVTIFAVVYQDDLAGSSNMGIIARDASGDRGWLLAIDEATGRAIFIVSTSSTARRRRDGDVVDLRRMPAVVTCRFDGTADEMSIWINGQLDNGAIDGSVPSVIGGAGAPLRIGTNGFNEPWGGYFGHMQVYDRALTDNEREAIEAELYELYELATIELTAVSADLNNHQGVATDGEFLYTTDTQRIDKRELDGTLVLSNTDPFDGIPASVNHCGDPAYYNGKLYVPVENFDLGGSSFFSDPFIAVYDAETLELESFADISAQDHEVSSIAIDPCREILWVSDWFDGAQLYVYDLNDLSFIGILILSEVIELIQGVSYNPEDGHIWVSNGRANTFIDDDSLRRIDPESGTVRRVYHRWLPVGEQAEGLDVSQGDTLLWLIDFGAQEITHFYDISVVKHAPAAPTITSPTAGQIVTSGSLTVEWNAATDPDGDPVQYEGHYWDGSAWQPLFALQSGLSYEWDLDGLLPGEYRVRVQSFDGEVYGACDIVTFTIETPTPPGALLSRRRLFVGRRSANAVLLMDDGVLDHGLDYATLIRTHVLAPAGMGGECVFTYVYIKTENFLEQAVEVRPIIDGRRLAPVEITLPDRTGPERKTTEVALRLDTGRARVGVRGAVLQVEARLLSAEDPWFRVHGIEAEYAVVREAYPLIQPSPELVRSPQLVPRRLLLVGARGGNVLYRMDHGRDDGGQPVTARVETMPLGPESIGGEAIFPYVYLVVTHANPLALDLLLTPIIDDVAAPPIPITLPGVVDRAFRVIEVPLHYSAGRSRQARRGENIRFRIETDGGLPDGDVVFDGAEVEFARVRESKPSLVNPDTA